MELGIRGSVLFKGGITTWRFATAVAVCSILEGVVCCFSPLVHHPSFHNVPRPLYAFLDYLFRLKLKYASARGRFAAEGDGHGAQQSSSA